MLIIAFFIIWKIFDLLISFLSPFFITIQGFFPYRDLINSYHLPDFLTAFANFDGAHYIAITTRGYAQYEQAFFPLYPLLIKFLAPIFGNNHLLTGLIISNLAFVIGIFILNKYLSLIYDVSENRKQIARNQSASWRIRFSVFRFLNSVFSHPKNLVILFLLSFPTSFFFSAVYTEGLFFLFTILTFYFIKKEKYFLAGLFGFMASLTRLVGVFLIIPIFIGLVYKIINQMSFRTLIFGVRNLVKRNNGPNNIGPRFLAIARNNKKQLKLLLSILLPILGLGAYSFYLFNTTGDPLYFFHAQSNFALNRSTNLILLPQVYYRYFKIFFTAGHNFQYYVSLFEFLTFSFVFSILLLDLRKILLPVIARERSDRGNPNGVKLSFDRLGLNLFSMINLLLPTFTGTLLSVPRFSLMSLSFFLYLAEIKNKWVKIVIAIIFTLLHILTLSFFIRGYFIS